MQYPSSPASLFSTAAREPQMAYAIRPMTYDHPNKKWNVFEVLDGHEIFVQAFDTLNEAQAFCNGEVIDAC